MLSNVSDINALLTGSSSDTPIGATSNSAVSTDSGFAVSAFQGQLDKTMQQTPGMEGTNEVHAVVDDMGAGLLKYSSVQTKTSLLATAQKLNLSTGEQNIEMSTVEKSRFVVRTTIQKVSDIEDALENGGATEFLTELKNLLLSLSNSDLDNLSIDENGLEALGDLLVQAGFDQASVEELMSNLTLTLEEGNGLISVSDFMDDLFELPLAEDEDITQAEALMPTSDLPYIKSLLSMMGVDEQEITSIMDEASEGTRGFDFDAFIEQLEQLSSTAGESGLTYQTDGEDDAYTTLLKQLDLDYFIEESGEPLTLTTVIDAFAQKLDSIKDNLPDQTEQSVAAMFTTNSFDALATQSGRHGLLNQLFSGLNIQENSEETINSTIALSATSNAMVKEIEDRFQVQFMDQINRGDVSTKTAADAPTSGITASADIQTGKTDSDGSFKIANNFSDTKESTSQISIKAAQADAAALEKVGPTNNFQPGDATSKISETQTLVFGMEKSTTAATVGTSDTQRSQQAFSTLPDFVTRQVGKSIVRSINTGDDTIRMQLKPAELGRVYMSIEHNGSAMKVSIITEHQSAKDILAANVNDIKTMLSSSGISLESFEVDMSSDFQQSMADARAQDQSNQSARKKHAKGGAGDDAQEDTTDNLSVQTAVINNSGALHFVA
nr:flagellar hook-length control protein FliK [uncultured Desulfobacter sp.]